MSFPTLLNCSPRFAGGAGYIAKLFKIKNQFNNSTIQQFNNGFSLIELLVVIGLFGLAASLVTASYLGFEKGQRVKNAAAQLKSDLRLVQNKALSGDKGTCPVTSFLGGWFLYVDKTAGNNTSYKIAGNCLTSAGLESIFGFTSFSLPRNVIISDMTYGSFGSQNTMRLLFRPLASGATFHNNSACLSPCSSTSALDFYEDNGSGLLKSVNRLQLAQPDPVIITLSGADGTNPNQVKILPSGEIQ